jgi:hypothetical protein
MRKDFAAFHKSSDELPPFSSNARAITLLNRA